MKKQITIYQVKEVFTPTTPARVAFVARDAINDRLVNALEMPGKQLIVYGHSGSGKTTLVVNKLEQLYEGHIITSCMKGMSFDQLVLNAFDQLGVFYTSERVSAQKTTHTAELAGTYALIQGKLNSSETTEDVRKEQRLLPPQLSPQELGKLMGAAKCCWVLEDFHKMDDLEKTKLAQLMKVFMDLADQYGDLKIVALGAVNTARQVVECDSEMRNRIAEIRVDLMTDAEIESIVELGTERLNLVIDSDLKSLIARYSNGLPSVCHHLCMYMCQAAQVLETREDQIEINSTHFETALKLYVDDASDSIRSTFDIALKPRRKTKFPNVSIVLEALSTFKGRGASRADLLTRIRKKHPKYSESSLKGTLQKLSTDDYGVIVRLDQASGLYSYADPFLLVYAKAHFHENGNSQSMRVTDIDMTTLIKMLVDEMSKNGGKGPKIIVRQTP